jgi:transglutaminase-like putative cysteine protease
MRLAIRHISRFKFDDNAPYALQRLRLRPQSGPGQTVRAWQVTIEGVEPGLSYTDGLGNRIDLVRHERGRPEIVIVAAGVVETQDRAGIVGESDGYAPPWIFERAIEGCSDETVEVLIDDIPEDQHGLEALHSLMTTIHELPSAPADAKPDALDPVELFVAAARRLKIPARYVTGYLAHDSGAQRLTEALSQAMSQSGNGAAQQQSSSAEDGEAVKPVVLAAAAQPQSGHAWVEGLGWVGFDPVLNRCPDERYVRLATGFDSRDTRSVSGQGAQAVAIEVSVIPSPELV